MSKNQTLKSSQQSRDLLAALVHITLHYGAPMSRYVAITTTGTKTRELLVSVIYKADVDTVREPLDVLLPRVIVITQPSPEHTTAMETASLISVTCNEMIDRE